MTGRFISGSSIALCGAVLVLVLPRGATAAVVRRTTVAGEGAARAALIERPDLGRGWREATAAPARVPGLTCPGFNPPVQAVEVGRAESPTYGQSSSGPFVTQTAYVYTSRSDEVGVWKALARPELVRCVAQALVAGSGGGVRFRVTDKQILGLPPLPGHAIGYRVSGTARTSGQTVDVFLDMILLGRGRTISAVSISTFQAPVSLRLELRLARAAARRMA